VADTQSKCTTRFPSNATHAMHARKYATNAADVVDATAVLIDVT